MTKELDRKFLGISKTMFNTGATLLQVDAQGKVSWQTSLSERVLRKKNSSSWPVKALDSLSLSIEKIAVDHIAHNSDIMPPRFKESLLAKKSPFYEMLKMHSLSSCTEKENPEISYVEHHLAHAYSSVIISPYKHCFVLVMDGGGSKRADTSLFQEGNLEEIEHTSLYYWNGEKLELLFKDWLNYEDSLISGLKFSQGVGSLYEKAAQFIFADSLSSGKVMGLAGFGEKFSGISKNTSYMAFLNSLDWSKAFLGGTKKAWQEHENLKYWKDLAASVQYLFEENLNEIATRIEKEWIPTYGRLPLIMTGGCALNCTANEKLRSQNIFPEIFISPFPGDESISLGCAIAKANDVKAIEFAVIDWSKQNSFFGGDIDFSLIPKLFGQYIIEEIYDYEKVCRLIDDGEVIAWFQGRSETGPRALGHRSLLASVQKKGIKRFLNSKIKFREDFRPYGASLLLEDVSKYFDSPDFFQNPFMSFAAPIREEYKDVLSEVCHIDGTCRMQTVMPTQNLAFYNLIKTLKELGQLPVILNTSLNIMGEPIVESLEDALAFFKQSIVRTIVIDRYLIVKKSEE